MNIGGLLKFSSIDYPNELACVIFTNGCNYDCYYCHNRHLIESGFLITEDDVISFLEARIGILDGVVVSGGEPTIQKNLYNFIEKIKNMGFKIKLDSNGSNPNVIEYLLNHNLVDYVAIDYKCEFSKYLSVCGRGINPRDIQKTIDILMNSSILWELRVTLIPEIDIPALLRMLHEIPKVPNIILKQYIIPEYYKEEDEKRIKKYHYEMVIFEKYLEELQKIQPNIKII